jgi:hypothetical protein
MNKMNESDKLLRESFRQAGLHKPGPDFTHRVMEKVSMQKSPAEKGYDWSYYATIASMIISLGLTIAFYPGFFRGLFLMTGFDHVIAWGLKVLKSLSLQGLISGQNAMILIIVITSTFVLLTIDKVLAGYKRFSSFFLMA